MLMHLIAGFASTAAARPHAFLQTALMNHLTMQQLLGLRLEALARDHHDVAAMRASIQRTPDSLVKELMDTHGWAAHEALSAVEQLQAKALQSTSEQAAA